MKDKPEERLERQKKPYTKPEVRKVTLTPEEAVLGSCKISGQSGPGYSGKCGYNPPIIICSTQVS